MPVSRHRLHYTDPPAPANGNGHDELRVPQARVLRVLMPADPSDHWIDWPVWTRTYLSLRRVQNWREAPANQRQSYPRLNGIGPDNTTSGVPTLASWRCRLVEAITLYIEGRAETNYRITAAGIRAYQAYLARGGKLPPVKDATTCTNARYAEVQGGESRAGPRRW